MYIVSLIPARSGSKGIKNKNIKELDGIPLIAYSIITSLNCPYIDKTIVTTDCPQIAKVSKKYGAEVPFLRPKNISEDSSTDYEFFKHYIEHEKNNGNKIPDLIVQLRPTCPTRTVNELNSSIKMMLDSYDDYDCLRSVVECKKSPYKMYRFKDNRLVPLFEEVDGIEKPYNRGRQELPKTYVHNGYIDIVKSKCITEHKSVTGDRIMSFIMDDNDTHDLDTIEDWKKLEEIGLN